MKRYHFLRKRNFKLIHADFNLFLHTVPLIASICLKREQYIYLSRCLYISACGNDNNDCFNLNNDKCLILKLEQYILVKMLKLASGNHYDNDNDCFNLKNDKCLVFENVN